MLPATPEPRAIDRDLPLDLVVVGGGINGCGIARDAAGRGLSVLLVEQGDLASATSQWSTKLVHGGLRYLEHYEFRLVGEALRERDVLLSAAPHLIEPLQFVLPHEPHLRPRWMIRAGLFLYDHLGGRTSLPKSRSERLDAAGLGAGLKPDYRRGFSYFDARVDDARLTIANARAAADLGAVIAPRTRFVGAAAADGVWACEFEGAAGDGGRHRLRARAIVNAAGPWVARVQDAIGGAPADARVRHVKGSHIVVPRLHPGEHAYILQNPDQRIVFIIPYLGAFSLIGTTDVAVDDFAHPVISDEEIAYLCATASRYCARPVAPADVVWSYSGVRPLYDDGAGEAAAVTRDYVLRDSVVGGAALVSVYGGKLTTYRKLAEHALERLAPHFPAMGRRWTHAVPLPGGDFRGGLAALTADLKQAYPFLPQDHLAGMARRHGTVAFDWLDEARSLADLGEHFGAGLYAREVDHMVAQEWALAADDVLYRRSKSGLMMDDAARAALAGYMQARTT
ncbi:MAG: glycerol-3-phosphate dehydrogenase [Burkholderiales bacterium]|nr:glycerol-3-phosphate dehydrogenase [Burkholderiales bacterium]